MFIRKNELYKLPSTGAPADQYPDRGPNLIERLQASGIPERTIAPQYPNITAAAFIAKEQTRPFGEQP